MARSAASISIGKKIKTKRQQWVGDERTIVFDPDGIRSALMQLHLPCYILKRGEKVGAANRGVLTEAEAQEGESYYSVPFAFPLTEQDLGDPGFKKDYNLKYAYIGGSMANGISSEGMVIALGKAGYLASFGAGGLLPARIEQAIRTIQKELPQGSYAFNLIHSPFVEALERKTVDLYLKHRVRVIEASAYINLTPHVVYYRVAGLKLYDGNRIHISNRIIAKVSRREVAEKFMSPAPESILKYLTEQGRIDQQQAEWARQVPMADDITVEADSGGHTDNRPLVALFPSIRTLRDEMQEKYRYAYPIRIGAAGGIGTPESALAAFMMGAAYIMTGSINQACIESGTSEQVKQILSQADMADVTMAPAADMFEMGVKLQVLKRGTLFPMRGQKLYDLYQAYDRIENIPSAEREKLEKQIFRADLDTVWQETVRFFQDRDQSQIERAARNPKKRMAMVFRWYLGLSSQWANIGKKGREMDYQIWCGPSMGAFNGWTRNSFLEKPPNRMVATVAKQMLTGVAYLYRLQLLKMQQVSFPPCFDHYRPTP